jgi:2TM domain
MMVDNEIRTLDEQEKLARAKRQVAAIKGFYIHLFVFVVVMATLFTINLVMTNIWWVQWPFLGWGIGLIAHALAVFGRMPRVIRNWETRKIQELKDKM